MAKLIGEAAVGPWTVDGQLQVKSIHLRGRTLSIEGRRLILFFDSGSNQLRDLASFPREEISTTRFAKMRSRDRKKNLAKQQHVEIEIGMVSETPSSKDISLTMAAIFLGPGESLADVVPSFWRSYFNHGSAGEGRKLYTPVYRVKEDGVLAPHSLFASDPEYSEEARQAGYQGTVVMSLVVDTTGTPRDIQILRPGLR